MPEIDIIANFEKRESCSRVLQELCSKKDWKTDTSIFYKDQNYLDRLLVPEMHEIPIFVKIIRMVLEIYESCVQGQTDI